MRKRDRNQLARIIISAVLLAAAALTEHFGGFPVSLPLFGFDIFPLLVYLVPYIPVAYAVLWSALRNIAHGQVFDENFLMSIATIAAFATGEYAEAVLVMLLYQVGDLFEHIAVGRSRQTVYKKPNFDPRRHGICRARGRQPL